MPEQHDQPPVEPSDGGVDALVRERLRATRAARGWSIDELARRSGVNASTISRIETGRRRLALDHLGPLARALGVTVDELLAPDPVDDIVLRPAPSTVDGMTLWPLSREGAPHGRDVFKLRIPAGRREGPQRTHPGREWIYVLDGVLRLRLADREHRVRPGQTVEFATTVPHAMDAPTGQVELLVIFDSHAQRTHLTD